MKKKSKNSTGASKSKNSAASNKLTKQGLRNTFDAFIKLKVLIIGDVMIDSYLWGKVERISPEAPVPILQVEKREIRPGGAANVALNIKSLGVWL